MLLWFISLFTFGNAFTHLVCARKKYGAYIQMYSYICYFLLIISLRKFTFRWQFFTTFMDFLKTPHFLAFLWITLYVSNSSLNVSCNFFYRRCCSQTLSCKIVGTLTVFPVSFRNFSFFYVYNVFTRLKSPSPRINVALALLWHVNRHGDYQHCGGGRG